VDTLFFGFMLNIVAHFKVLQNRFNTMFDIENEEKVDKKRDPLNMPSKIKTKKSTETSIKELFKYHESILDLSRKMNEVYAPIVFAQYLITSLILCVIGFQLIMV
jgi:gustatory receptor